MTDKLRNASVLALAVGAAIATSACTVRETRIVQPAAVAVPANSVAVPTGTTIVVPEDQPDIVVNID